MTPEKMTVVINIQAMAKVIGSPPLPYAYLGTFSIEELRETQESMIPKYNKVVIANKK